ncbi:hypothetical protein NL676_018035 [Syzygium grande]|nr:hypothetical protein NL676_018035 [Syzygium grande]
MRGKGGGVKEQDHEPSKRGADLLLTVKGLAAPEPTPSRSKRAPWKKNLKRKRNGTSTIPAKNNAAGGSNRRRREGGERAPWEPEIFAA